MCFPVPPPADRFPAAPPGFSMPSTVMSLWNDLAVDVSEVGQQQAEEAENEPQNQQRDSELYGLQLPNLPAAVHQSDDLGAPLHLPDETLESLSSLLEYLVMSDGDRRQQFKEALQNARYSGLGGDCSEHDGEDERRSHSGDEQQHPSSPNTLGLLWDAKLQSLALDQALSPSNTRLVEPYLPSSSSAAVASSGDCLSPSLLLSPSNRFAPHAPPGLVDDLSPNVNSSHHLPLPPSNPPHHTFASSSDHAALGTSETSGSAVAMIWNILVAQQAAAQGTTNHSASSSPPAPSFDQWGYSTDSVNVLRQQQVVDQHEQQRKSLSSSYSSTPTPRALSTVGPNSPDGSSLPTHSPTASALFCLSPSFPGPAPPFSPPRTSPTAATTTLQRDPYTLPPPPPPLSTPHHSPSRFTPPAASSTTNSRSMSTIPLHPPLHRPHHPSAPPTKLDPMSPPFTPFTAIAAATPVGDTAGQSQHRTTRAKGPTSSLGIIPSVNGIDQLYPRTQLHAIIYHLIQVACDRQAARWDKGEDLADLEEEEEDEEEEKQLNPSTKQQNSSAASYTNQRGDTAASKQANRDSYGPPDDSTGRDSDVSRYEKESDEEENMAEGDGAATEEGEKASRQERRRRKEKEKKRNKRRRMAKIREMQRLQNRTFATALNAVLPPQQPTTDQAPSPLSDEHVHELVNSLGCLTDDESTIRALQHHLGLAAIAASNSCEDGKQHQPTSPGATTASSCLSPASFATTFSNASVGSFSNAPLSAEPLTSPRFPQLPRSPAAASHTSLGALATGLPSLNTLGFAPALSSEMQRRRQEYRNRSVGILLSSIKMEWTRHCGSLCPLMTYMSMFGIKKIKFLLMGVPDLIITGAGGFTRVTTVDHAQRYCDPFPPQGLGVDGKTLVLSTVTHMAPLPLFQGTNPRKAASSSMVSLTPLAPLPPRLTYHSSLTPLTSSRSGAGSGNASHKKSPVPPTPPSPPPSPPPAPPMNPYSLHAPLYSTAAPGSLTHPHPILTPHPSYPRLPDGRYISFRHPQQSPPSHQTTAASSGSHPRSQRSTTDTCQCLHEPCSHYLQFGRSGASRGQSRTSANSSVLSFSHP